MASSRFWWTVAGLAGLSYYAYLKKIKINTDAPAQVLNQVADDVKSIASTATNVSKAADAVKTVADNITK